MNKLAIILRGLPGSGKSHWVDEYIAKQGRDISARVRDFGYFSTDSQFYVNGRYRFDVRRLSEYHQVNLTRFIEALAASEPIVICDNTNLAHWEYMAYHASAEALGYRLQLVLIGDPQDRDHQTICATRNTHGISLVQIQAMAQKFEA